MNQLLCITHDICQSLDDGLEKRVVFLDKAVDKVWHESLLYKLKQWYVGQPFNRYQRFFVPEKELF